MKISRKITALLCSMTLVGSMLVGCSDSGNSDQSGTDSESWPTKSINLIMTHGAGGDTDYNGRLLARLLEKELGQTVVVTNVTGGNGSIAMTQYKDGENDGYTFLATNTVALACNEATGLSDFGYDSFEPVSVYGKQCGENILVSADAPYNTLEEFIEASKSNPGKLKLGVSMGGSSYVAATIMEKEGAKFSVVDSGDGADRMTALIGGHIDATIAPYTLAKEYIENGDVKTLCTLLSERSEMLPEIPTAIESGNDKLVVDTLYGVFAPKGTDEEIVEKLNAAILKIVNENEEYKKAVEEYNFQSPWALSVEETKSELEKQRNHFMSYSEYLQ